MIERLSNYFHHNIISGSHPTILIGHKSNPSAASPQLLINKTVTLAISLKFVVELFYWVCTRNPHWTESPLDGIPTARNPQQISCSGDSVPWCPESPLDGIPTARLTSRLHVL